MTTSLSNVFCTLYDLIIVHCSCYVNNFFVLCTIFCIDFYIFMLYNQF
nr:MAG TPA: hypothetical protein [Bacteriophage sp.]